MRKSIGRAILTNRKYQVLVLVDHRKNITLPEHSLQIENIMFILIIVPGRLKWVSILLTPTNWEKIQRFTVTPLIEGSVPSVEMNANKWPPGLNDSSWANEGWLTKVNSLYFHPGLKWINSFFLNKAKHLKISSRLGALYRQQLCTEIHTHNGKVNSSEHHVSN